jgi:hypothetical protein
MYGYAFVGIPQRDRLTTNLLVILKDIPLMTSSPIRTGAIYSAYAEVTDQEDCGGTDYSKMPKVIY